MLEILGKTSIDFMGLRRYSFAFSGVLIFVGLAGGGEPGDRLRGGNGRAVEV